MHQNLPEIFTLIFFILSFPFQGKRVVAKKGQLFCTKNRNLNFASRKLLFPVAFGIGIGEANASPMKSAIDHPCSKDDGKRRAPASKVIALSLEKKKT